MKLKALVRLVPGVQQLNRKLHTIYDSQYSNNFLKFASPGHFYSPIPDLDVINQQKARIFETEIRDIPGIDTNKRSQLDLLNEFERYHSEFPFEDSPSSKYRYHIENPFFGYGDALILYSMMRHFRPKRIIEVGSGFTSALMMETNDDALAGECRFTFIEPYPERLLSLIQDRERYRLITSEVQEVDTAEFKILESRDILFIDSSHVAKVGSDVVHLLTNVLPILNPGVIIHFHDIFWPFEYPEELVRMGVAWNESYMLKAFLQFNSKFRILFFNSYLAIHHRALLESKVPLFLRNTGGSLWIEKIS